MKTNLGKLLLGLLLLPSMVFAEVTFNGFASITAGVTLGDDEEHLGYTNDASFKPGSIFALQAKSDLGDGLSATAQIVAEGVDDFKTRFEWAYIAYELNDENSCYCRSIQKSSIFIFRLFRCALCLSLGISTRRSI